MRSMKWLDKHLEMVVISVTLCSLVFIMALQVFMRYVMNDSLSWPEELSRYLFIWMAFIGVSYATKAEIHLKIDMILEYVHPKIQAVFAIVRDASLLLFSVIMIFGGIDVYYSLSKTMQTSPALELPFQFVYLALPAGFLLTALRIIQKYVIKARSTNKPHDTEHRQSVGF